MKDKLELYQKLEKEIYEYFGRKETWKVYPINFMLDVKWYISGDELIYFDDKNNEYCEDIICNQIHRKEDFTMICTDTHCDGNDFLQILDSKKELKSEV